MTLQLRATVKTELSISDVTHAQLTTAAAAVTVQLTALTTQINGQRVVVVIIKPSERTGRRGE